MYHLSQIKFSLAVSSLRNLAMLLWLRSLNWWSAVIRFPITATSSSSPIVRFGVALLFTLLSIWRVILLQNLKSAGHSSAANVQSGINVDNKTSTSADAEDSGIAVCDTIDVSFSLHYRRTRSKTLSASNARAASTLHCTLPLSCVGSSDGHGM